MKQLRNLDEQSRQWFSQAALFSIACVAVMGKPWESLLQAWDSSLHARVALQVSSGGWLPRFPMQWMNLDFSNPVYNDHPFPLFYLAGKFMRFFGANAWSARFLPSLFSVLALGVLYRLVRTQFHHRIAILASVLVLSTPMWFQHGAKFQLDPAMIFWILISFALWRKVHLPGTISLAPAFLAGLASGLAVAFKNPVGFLLLPVAWIVDFGFQSHRSVRSLLAYALLGAGSLLPSLLIWAITIRLGGWHLFEDYFSRQVLGSALHGRGYGSPIDPFYFWKVLRQSYLPGLLVLAGSCIAILLSGNRPGITIPRNRDLQIHLVAVAVLVTVLTLIRFKYPYYFLPVFPFLSVVVACVVDRAFRAAGRTFTARTIDLFLIPAGLLLPLALVVFPVSLTAEQFPAIRKFMPFIQTHSKPGDRVMYVNHVQPYGNDGDTYVEIAFYTNRGFTSASCDGAAGKVAEVRPEWIITSGTAPGDCLTPALLGRYPFRVRAGNQFLLSSRDIPAENGVFDLTPLYLELNATVDDEPPPLPKNQFHRYE